MSNAFFEYICSEWTPLATDRRSGSPQGPQPGCGREALVPTSWVHVALPVLVLMREFANRMMDAAARPDFQQAFTTMCECIERWQSSDPMEADNPMLSTMMAARRTIHARVQSRKEQEQTRAQAAEKARTAGNKSLGRRARPATPRKFESNDDIVKRAS